MSLTIKPNNKISQEMKLLVDKLEIRLVSNRIYDLFTCEMTRVYKIVYKDGIEYISKNDFEELKKLGLTVCEYDD